MRGDIMPNSEKRLAFISYGGSIDAKIANLLCEFLEGFFSYKAAVYCTASDDNRVGAPYGEDFSDSYMNNIKTAEVFIPLLSENYLHSTTTLVEMGAAYALGKKFIPFLVSGCDYSKLQPLYNIRNSDMYAIDNQQKLKKALERINTVLGTSNPISEDKIRSLIRDITQLKSGYKTNISKRQQIKFVCSKLFLEKDKYETLISDLGKENILDICITNYADEKVQECRLYFKENKSVADLVTYLDGTEFSDNYDLIEIEG